MKTAIIVFCKEEILIWAIPPLSPQSSNLPDHFHDNNSTHIPPLFKIPFPDGTARHTHEIDEWMIVSPWYFRSWDSVYFGILYTDSTLQRFKIIIKLDLSDASLHFINMFEIVSNGPGLIESLESYTDCDGFRICEDALVYFWNNRKTWGVYAGLISAPFTTNVLTNWDGHVDSLCPTSGRFVYCTGYGHGTFINTLMVISDLF